MRHIDSGVFDRVEVSGSSIIPDFVERNQALSFGLSTAKAISTLKDIITLNINLPIVTETDFQDRFDDSVDGDTRVGKDEILKKTIKRPRPNISREYSPPRTQAQKSIVSIWEYFLALDKVGIDDDFFELGGDSLILMQIHKKVQSNSDVNIPIAELYNLPTIKQLSHYIENYNFKSKDKVLSEVKSRSENQKKAAARRKINRTKL